MKIAVVHENTPAQRLGLQPGDELIAINDQNVQDVIDFHFYYADGLQQVTVGRGDHIFTLSVDISADEWFGVEFAEMPYRCCGNNCIFCFIDQNPPGLRPSLYFKDEDFRLSFLYGNYVTLTHVSPKDLQRIVTQRLSPLYISVHSTDAEIRKRLLGLRKDDHLLEKIAFLAQNDIEMHIQIVLCPGLNDGASLQQTMDDLVAFYPQVRSVAVVPVGLTAHRRGLPQLTAVTPAAAQQIISWAEAQASKWLREIGSYFIYLADEFYLLAQQPLPPKKRYEHFAQIENGVGMTRAFIDTFRRQRRWLPRSWKGEKLILLTGTLAAPVLEKEILPDLIRIDGLEVELIPIENRFYGGHVSVSGLLVGQDICAQLPPGQRAQAVVLPPNCLNGAGLFLDDWSPAKLANELGVNVIQAMDFLHLFKLLK